MRFLSPTLLVVSFFISGLAHAALIEFQPTLTTVTTGQDLVGSVSISGLSTGTAPSVSAFDLDVSYDSSLVSLTGFSFGDDLDVLGLGSVRSANTATPGLANFLEVSLDSIFNLNALQPDAFPLLMLNFTALAAGTASIGLVLNALADAAGAPLPATLIAGSVSVNGVPLPSTGSLLLAALVGLALVRRSRQL